MTFAGQPEHLDPGVGSSDAPRRLAVTGGTGAIGVRLLDNWLHGWPDLQVTALVRTARPAAFARLLDRYPKRVTLVEGDLCRLADLSPADRRRLGETDGLWHLAASTAMHGRSADDAATWRVNDGGTRAVLDLLASVDAPGPLVHLSTAYVCGTRTGRVAEADLPTGGFRNAYEASKAAAERRVRAAMAAGLGGCVLRPSVVVEDQASDGAPKMIDVVAAAVLAADRAGERLVLRLPPTAALNVVHADWVLAAMTAVAAAGGSGRTYHLTARQPLRLADLPLVLDEAAATRDLPPVSRRLDRAIGPFRPYLCGDVQFDRANFEAVAAEVAGEAECDTVAILQRRRQQARSLVAG